MEVIKTENNESFQIKTEGEIETRIFRVGHLYGILHRITFCPVNAGLILTAFDRDTLIPVIKECIKNIVNSLPKEEKENEKI